MTERPPNRTLNDRIHDRFAALGGVELDLPPREPRCEPPRFDQTLAEIRSRFVNMSAEELKALIEEVVAAARAAKSRTANMEENEAQGSGAMRHEDFQVGGTFWSGRQRWRCTDIGTRVIAAIKLNHEDEPNWYNGPLYAVAKSVFDEYDIEGCKLEPDPEDVDPSAPMPDAAAAQAADKSWDSPEDQAAWAAKAAALRGQARAGLCFDAYLPSDLADWLLAQVERGTFRDPSKAVFVILGEYRELEPHGDLRDQLLKRRVQAAIDDPRPAIPSEEVFRKLQKRAKQPRPEPAVWWGKP